MEFVFMAVCSIICLFGMIGDREQANRNNYTYGFVTCIIMATLLTIL